MSPWSIRRTFAGAFRRPDEVDERRIEVHLSLRLGHATLRSGVIDVVGSVDAEHLADGRPVTGTISLRSVGEGRVPWVLDFESDSGSRRRLELEQRFVATSGPFAPTRAVGRILDDAGAEEATAELRIDFRSGFRRLLFGAPDRLEA